MSLLHSTADHYDGVIVTPEHLPLDAELFASRLAVSLQAWQSQGKRGVWMKLPLERASLLPAATAAGFDFHHAKPGYAMLTKWLPATPCTIPESHMYSVGVGAFIINSRRKILLVQEANGILKGKGIWKFVTGLLDHGEDVGEAAEREVLEETGITAEFDCILSIRQSHGLMFGRSDIFFVCALKMERDQDIVLQESELTAGTWMPIDEAAAMPIFASGSFKTVFDACKAYADGTYSGFAAEKLVNSFNKRTELLMHGLSEPQAS